MPRNAPWNIPEVPIVHPNGSCYCGCGEIPRSGRYFVITYDRKAEECVIKERFGSISAFVAWAEVHRPKMNHR